MVMVLGLFLFGLHTYSPISHIYTYTYTYTYTYIRIGLVLTLLLGRITKTLFFGQLRDVEVELLYENARYAVTETCLALTIFRYVCVCVCVYVCI
jgi:hypothetical protein